MKRITLAGAAMAMALFSADVSATPFTTTSPTTGGAVPVGVTEVGGIVIDMIGTNGSRVVSQLAASSLYVGYAGTNPLTIGTQTGFAPVISALGGGLSQFAVRVTLWDGDTAPGNFDDGDNMLLIDGITIANWSGVATQETSSDGLTLISSQMGFANNELDTGWFLTTDGGILASIYAAMADGSLAIGLYDTDPYDNYYDFTQGVDGGLINVQQAPTVTTAVPEPGTMALFGVGLVGLAAARRRKSS